ncbi:MAG: DegV family EDD domain-containing protein [Lachnospiraceae bacterium]|nr:DegV family EDD domain-containing protein [Lachnospiraceae bacterium]
MIKKLIKDIRDAISDYNRGFSERVFLIFSLLSEVAVIIALIGDIIAGENIGEIIVIGVLTIAVPLVTITSLYRNKIRLAEKLLVTALVFVIIPGLFFFGGGIEGGGVLWIIFAYVYIGLVISGVWRTVMIVMVTILAGACYFIEYIHPEYVAVHSREMFFVDSFISLILVGLICFFMTWVQNRMLTDENARAKKEAEKSEELARSQNRFFSSMSHEIRTPINSILGLNELILRDHDASDEIIKDANGIQGAGKMLLALINDILDFSKIEAGSMDIVPVDYQIGDMLSDIVNMIWLRAHDKGLAFNVSVDPKVPAVLYGDEVRIKQVIVNLLNNAVKYTKEGSVELHIESSDISEKTVELSISVSDTGMGIKKEALPYLFDAFKRVDEKKNRHIEGTGLGLSIVKQIVELMDGSVSVNSVYGEGSTFTVVVRQEVSDHTAIGELNIHGEQDVRRSNYEAGFKAPEAKILIVDDNEMNLEVESKLLTGTEIMIDQALSGAEALSLTLKRRYDTILMDHLMPEMDGIECLEMIRAQSGGLNRNTPVIVLTANAGSDNKELYNRAGFDGYLVKPVSGEALENTLIKYISADKLIISSKVMTMHEDINASSGYFEKLPVIITSNSVCDLPSSVIKKLNIPIMPVLIRTDEGVFKDGIQMDADELIRYMENGGNAASLSMNEEDYTEFFANALKRAHNLIHISINSGMSSDYEKVTEAAKAFDNVTVVNSGVLSSATGILVLIAYKLAQQGVSVPDIVAELERIKERINCNFVVNTTEYMAKIGFVSPFVHKVAQSFNLHPSISFKDDKYRTAGIWMGSTRRAYRKFIHKAFPVDIIPDPDILFITYVNVPTDTLLWIKEEISKIAYFENVVFKQASAAVSSGCGSGTFGIMYFAKSNKSYNIASFLNGAEEDRFREDTEEEDEAEDDNTYNEYDHRDDRPTARQNQSDGGADKETADKEAFKRIDPKADRESDSGLAWYECIEGIDGAAGIQNASSEELYRSLLEMFYQSIPDKHAEIDGFYLAEDWDNYTIKIHALKSSARLIGAIELGDKAQLLENAGKEGNISYIHEQHSEFMQNYVRFQELLSDVFGSGSEEGSFGASAADGDNGGDAGNKPAIDHKMLQEIYEKLRIAADEIDSDAIDELLEELSGYSLPEEDNEICRAVSRFAENYEYDGITEALNSKLSG